MTHAVQKEQIRIRNIGLDDAKALISFLNRVGGETTFLTFGRNEYRISIAEEERWIEAMSIKSNCRAIVAECNGEIIGIASVRGSAHKRVEHVGEFGITIRHDYWGKGLGTTMTNEIVKWARVNPKLKKLTLKVRSDNNRAIMIYKKVGFQQEGVLRDDFFVDGTYYDCILMGLLLK